MTRIRDIPKNLGQSLREIVSEVSEKDITRPITNVQNTSGFVSPTGGINLNKKPIYSGGGGGAPAPTGVSGGGISQAEQEAEKQRLAAEIEKERQKAIFEANRDYRANLRNISSQSERINELNKLRENIARIQANAKLERVEKGIVSRTTFTKGGYAEGSKYIPREEIKVRGEDIQGFRETYGLGGTKEKPIVVSESIYRDVETKANQGDIEAQNILNRIKQSKGGYVTLPPEVRPSVKTGSSYFGLYKETNPLMTSPIKSIIDVYKNVSDKTKEKILKILGLSVSVTNLPYNQVNNLITGGYNSLSDTQKEKLIKYTSSAVQFSAMPYNAPSVLYKQIPEETRQNILTTGENLFIRSVKSSPIVKTARDINRIPNKIDLAKKGFNLFVNEVKTSPIVKYTPSLIQAGIIGTYPQVSGYNVLKVSEPYVKKGVEKVSPYIKESLPYVNLLGYRQLNPQDIFLGISKTKPYAEKVIEKTAPYIKKVLPYTQFLGYRQINPSDIYFGVKEISPYISKVTNIKTSPTNLQPINLMLSDIFKARETEYKLEPSAREILNKVNQLNIADYETQQKLIKQLEEIGFKFENQFDYFTGEKKTNIVYPSWIQNLRPDFETKISKEAFVPFFVRKLKTGISENVAEIYQRGIYTGATILQPSKPIIVSREAKEIGGLTAGAFELGLYSVPYVGTAMFLGGTAEAVTRGGKRFVQYAKENPLEVGLAGGYAGYKIIKGANVLRKLAKPKIRTETLTLSSGRKPLTLIDKPYYREIRELPTGENIVTDYFKVSGISDYSKAGYRKIKTSGLRELFGLEPKIIKEVKPTFTQEAFSGIAKVSYREAKKPIISLVGVQVSKPVKFRTPFKTKGGRGIVKFIDTAGQEMKNKGALSLFSSDIELQKAILGLKGEVYTPTKWIGKTKEQLKQLSAIKQIGNLKSFNLYKEASISKRLVPNKRDLIQGISNIIAKTGEPEYTLTKFAPFRIIKTPINEVPTRQISRGGNVFKSIYGKPTPSQEQEAVKNIISLVPKPTPSTEVKIVSEVIPPTKISMDLLKAEVLVKTSAGLGENQFSGTAPSGRIKSLTGAGRYEDLGVAVSGRLGDLDLGVSGRGEAKTLTKEEQELRKREEELNKFFTGVSPKPAVREKTKEAEKQKERLESAQLTKQKQLQAQVTMMSLLQREKEKQQAEQPRTPRVPKIPLFKLPLGTAKAKVMNIAQDLKEFEVFTRKKGQEISLGEFPTFKEARKKLISEVKGTLRASAFITKGGEKIQFEKLDLGFEFQPGKKEPFRAVQKRGFRLGTSGEVREIILAKRGGKSKRFKLI